MNPIRTIVFTDLDDTLIQTKHKIPQGADFSLGATDQAGRALSFFTQAQQRLLALFEHQKALIIPVTGRDTKALNRVQYLFNDYAIVSHGALVLKNNQLDQDWLKQINPDLAHWTPLLEQNNQQIQQIIQTHHLNARVRVVIDQQIPAYVSIKGEGRALAVIKQYNTLRKDFRIHENGRNHALLPPYTSKKKAVQYLQEKLAINKNDLVIGLGDSLSDLPFMQACQFSMVPNTSQISKQLNNVSI